MQTSHSLVYKVRRAKFNPECGLLNSFRIWMETKETKIGNKSWDYFGASKRVENITRTSHNLLQVSTVTPLLQRRAGGCGWGLKSTQLLLASLSPILPREAAPESGLGLPAFCQWRIHRGDSSRAIHRWGVLVTSAVKYKYNDSVGPWLS